MNATTSGGHDASQGCVLLTGFEPFGGESVNPSWEAVRQLEGERIQGHRIVTCLLPTAFDASLPVLQDMLQGHDPSVVIAVGLAGGRTQISLEQVAINLIDARIADNRGAQPIGGKVFEDGPDGLFATLPLKSMLQALHRDNVPAAISYSAGTYVCNYVFYALMHLLRERPDVAAGFVHVPYLPQQTTQRPGTASMSLATMLQGLRVMVRSALQPESVDAGMSAGREA